MIGWFRALVIVGSDTALSLDSDRRSSFKAGAWLSYFDTLACNQERTRGPRKLVVRGRVGWSKGSWAGRSRHGAYL